MMKILVVTNPEATDSIHCYSAKMTGDTIWDVEQAFENLGIEVPVSDVEDIAHELSHGRNQWWNETYCFDMIYV